MSFCLPRSVPFLLALITAGAAACGGDDAGAAAGPDAGLDPAALWADLEGCGLTGALRVTQAPATGACAEWPFGGE